MIAAIVALAAVWVAVLVWLALTSWLLAVGWLLLSVAGALIAANRLGRRPEPTRTTPRGRSDA